MQELTNAALNALWQVPLLALAVALLGVLTQRLEPSRRAWIWLAALLVAGVLPVISVWSFTGNAALNKAAFVIRTDAWSGPVASSKVNLAAIVAFMLIAGRTIFLLAGWLRLQNLRRRADSKLILCGEVAAPFTFGARRPMIVVPSTLWARASLNLRRAIIAHERAHIRRRDYLWNFLMEIATAAIWWHPAVWWMKSRYAVEREFACDEEAAKHVPAYTRHLLDAAQLICGRTPGLALGLFDSNVLEERIMKLVNRPLFRLGSLAARAIQFAAILAVVATALLIARHPVALAAAPEESIYKIGEGVTSPSLLKKVEPEYTKEAKDAKIEGVCILYVVISEKGIAERVSVHQSLDQGLDQNAISAVTQWRFSPAMKDGKPVKVAATIEVNFKLI